MSEHHVTLANTWDGKKDPTGWFMSEKLDGIRAIWNGTDFVSRANKPIYAPQSWKAGMPLVVRKPLDGELYAGRGNFQRCSSIVRKLNPITSEWASIRYMCFDTIDTERPWVERFRVEMSPCLIPVPHFEIKSVDYMMEFYKSIVDNGGEGIMLRNPNARYEFRRSPNLLKVKPENTMTAEVIAHQPGEGKYVGMLGALVCKAGNIQFEVGTGFTDADRTEKYAPKIGSIITVKYPSLTDSGKPRHPVYVPQV